MTPRAALVLVIPLLSAACGAGQAPAGTAGPAGPAAPSTAAAATARAAAGGGDTSATRSGATALGEQRSEGGAVEVVATWSSTDPPSLKLTLDTHSVDLDRYDLATVTKLRLDGGEWAAPTRADVPKGGHHRGGTLTFGSVPSTAFGSARLIELRIVEVGVAERILRWQPAG